MPYFKKIQNQLTNYICRPSPLYFAQRMNEQGRQIYFKRVAMALELKQRGLSRVSNTNTDTII
jgi:tryptophan synthase beta subunit